MQTLFNNYKQKTPQRTKLLDVFMGFLVAVGALQFLYCLIVGNYVWQSTLTLSLWLYLYYLVNMKLQRLTISLVIAFQCVSGWLLSHGWAVRFDGWAEDSDESRKREGVQWECQS